jgi:hypothetical protein
MQKENLARKYIAFAALPDDRTVISIQRAKAINRARTVEVAALTFNVPNDIYNKSVRTIVYGGGEKALQGCNIASKKETIDLGSYVSVDGKIAIASSEPLTLVRRGKRQIGLKETPDTGTLYCEEICSSYKNEKNTFGRGDEIFTAHFAVAVGDDNTASKLSESLISYDMGDVRTASCVGADGKRYILIMNTGADATSVELAKLHTGALFNLKEGKEITSLILNTAESVLLRCE